MPRRVINKSPRSSLYFLLVGYKTIVGCEEILAIIL